MLLEKAATISCKDIALLPVWNKIYKTKFIRENHIMFDENKSISEDRFFNINVMLKANVISAQNDTFYYYNKNNENSVTTKYSPKTLEKYLEEKREIIKFIEFNEQNKLNIIKFRYNQNQKIFFQLIYYTMIEINKNWIKINDIDRMNNIFMQKEFIEATYSIKEASFWIRIMSIFIRLRMYRVVYIMIKIRALGIVE